ncbi:glycoside hydrolase family 97 catalytic domain-containing protein [Kitasatospora sp. NPDC058201]|uniref:glycoside hydrolase family 97 catalytic domain-containing protein n=1 Tax=unclassified Kitasatospora TaxID=2633591 RepID=UPI003654B589
MQFSLVPWNREVPVAPSPTRPVLLVGRGRRRSRRGIAATAALSAGAFALPALPATAAVPGSWTSVQPGASGSGCDGVRATVALNASGALTLGATWDCKQALIPAPIGLVTSTVDYSTGLEFVSRTDTPVTDTYTVMAGKSRTRTRTATETRLVFGKGTARITVLVRTSPDGVALRYELPSAATILNESTSFELPSDAQLTHELGYYNSAHEGEIGTSQVSVVPTGEYGMAMFAQLSNGTRVLLAESGVGGHYSGGRFTHTLGTGRFTVKLADTQVVTGSAISTPWRVAAIGSTATVVESTLVDDVAPPSKVADTSWIKPGISAWAWFGEGRAGQANLDKLKTWVDYASSQGWPYMMVDDGWKDNPSIIPALVAYGLDRGVKIMLWYDSKDLATQAQRDAEFTKITGWGIVGVKLDFIDEETQVKQQWYDVALADAARYRLMVDFHGNRLPVGVHRTWPQVLTSEAVRGEEYGRGFGSRTIGTVAALPFTRGAVGPTDYSPMGFQQLNPNSDAAELALGVLLDSGITLPGGWIAENQARPESQRWLRNLPTVWDETRFVSGDPLTGAVIARRSGERWFVGALNSGSARTISYPTAFLGSGTWLAEITTDGTGGLVRTSQTIQAGQTLSVPAVANGGHAVKLTRVHTVSAGYHPVMIVGTNQVIAVRDSSTADGAQILRRASHGTPNQYFEFRSLGDGYVRIVNQNSGKDVVVFGASQSAGAKIVQYAYAPGVNTNDEWLLEDAGSARVRILNRLSNLYLTAGPASGDQFEQRPYDPSGIRQTFTIA